MCTTISVYAFVCENQLDPNTPSSLHCYGCCCGEKSAHNDNKTAKKVRQQKQHDANLDKPLEKCFPCLATGQFVG